MPRIAELYNDLDQVGRFYQPVTLTRNYCCSGNSLSWNSYKPGILDSYLYPLEYDQLLNGRQYSVLWKNLDFMQFYYSIKQDEARIVEARLAYYPRPFTRQTKVSEFEESTCYDEFLDGALTDDYVFRQLSQTHLRFDYNERELAGAPCHLQFGGLNRIRVSMRKLLYPLAFADFIALNVYPDERKRLAERDDYRAALAWSRSKSINYPATEFDLIYGTHE